jgi:hypothetical protein
MFKRSHFVWNEPWFFGWRVRHWRSWLALVALLLLTVGVTAAALYFFMPKRPPLLNIVWISLGVAFLLWAFIDGPFMRRSATLDADSLYIIGDFGKFSRHEQYKLAGIQLAVIRRAEELKWPFPALFFLCNGEEVVVGINRGISLSRLASAMHALNVPVQLEGWDPRAENEFARTFRIEVADPAAVRPTARIEQIDPSEPKLWTPIGMAIAIVKQCWAGALAIAVIVGAVIHLYRNWRALGLVDVVLSILIPIGVMYLAGVFTERFATASTSSTLGKYARNQIRRRRNVALNIEDDKVHPVEIFHEDQFAKAIQHIHEMGYIEVNIERQQLMFEGKKERWLLPADCLRSLSIEEVQVGAAGDAAFGAINYYVVIEFDTQEKREKLGLRCSKRDFGPWNDVKRAQQAIELFDYIAPLVEINAIGPARVV